MHRSLTIRHNIFPYVKLLLLLFEFFYLTEEGNWILKHEKLIEEQDVSVLN